MPGINRSIACEWQIGRLRSGESFPCWASSACDEILDFMLAFILPLQCCCLLGRAEAKPGAVRRADGLQGGPCQCCRPGCPSGSHGRSRNCAPCQREGLGGQGGRAEWSEGAGQGVQGPQVRPEEGGSLQGWGRGCMSGPEGGRQSHWQASLCCPCLVTQDTRGRSCGDLESDLRCFCRALRWMLTGPQYQQGGGCVQGKVKEASSREEGRGKEGEGGGQGSREGAPESWGPGGKAVPHGRSPASGGAQCQSWCRWCSLQQSSAIWIFAANGIHRRPADSLWRMPPSINCFGQVLPSQSGVPRAENQTFWLDKSFIPHNNSQEVITSSPKNV